MIIYQLGLILKLGKVRAQREELKAAQVKTYKLHSDMLMLYVKCKA